MYYCYGFLNETEIVIGFGNNRDVAYDNYLKKLKEIYGNYDRLYTFHANQENCIIKETNTKSIHIDES